MHSNFRLVLTVVALGAILLAGCTFASPASDSTTIGHWEIVRQINYSELPETSLKGDIGPAYLVYLVTLAGFHTDSFGITVGPDDDARYTVDSGQSWTKASSALHCRHGLEIVDEKTAWHCGNGGTRISTDGGQSWKTVTTSACPHMSFLDAQSGWTASSVALQTTTDGGATWNKLTLPPTAKDIASLALRTASDGYVLDTAGNLFVTTDGGKNWETKSLGLKTDERLLTTAVGPKAVMRFMDARRGMVVFDLEDGTVWFAVTEDGGQSWQRAEIPELRGRSLYYNLYLARDGSLLTVTDDFNNGKNISLVLRYKQP